MDNLLDKLEQICKCGVCLERFNDPKQLSCQHIFCQRCLMKACIINKMGIMSLFCPTCRERQPMVYNSYDVMKLKPSFFISQILEVVVEFSEIYDFKRDQCQQIHSDGSSEKKLLNTKITSVYKSINKDTNENLIQIRTDEFSMRDSKVHQLEEEVKRTKQINLQLMINNFIMKTKLDSVSSNSKKNKEVETSLKSSETTLVEKTNIFGNHDEQGKSICKLDNDDMPSKRTISIGDKLNQYLSRKNAVCNNSNTNKNKDNARVDNFKESYKEFKNLSTTQPNSTVQTTSSSATKSENEFCWRCLRIGHSGSKCKESKTILGRYICQLCNKAGHKDENCVESNISIIHN